MHAERLGLDADVPIPVLEPLRTVNQRLLDLLRSLDGKDWSTPTVHPDRDVKDIAAHLLHGNFRRVTARRDGYRPPTPEMRDMEDLIALIQEDNWDFMRGMRRISPQIITELVGKYDEALVSIFEGLDPDARTSVSIPAEVAWRVWTKSMDRGAARDRITFSGNESVVDGVVSFVAIMA
jgi:hypothetical protein